jgi:hypothetical protein
VLLLLDIIGFNIGADASAARALLRSVEEGYSIFKPKMTLSALPYYMIVTVCGSPSRHV